MTSSSKNRFSKPDPSFEIDLENIPATW